jgi:hypothetical protein
MAWYMNSQRSGDWGSSRNLMPASISTSASGRFLLFAKGRHQSRAGQPDQLWSLAAAREEAPVVVDTVEAAWPGVAR